MKRLLMCCLMVAAVAAGRAGTDGTWTSSDDGAWSDTSKWLGGIVADGPGSTATLAVDFTRDIGVLTLGAPKRVIGHLTVTNTSVSATERTVSTGSAGSTEHFVFDADDADGVSVVDIGPLVNFRLHAFAGSNAVEKTGKGVFFLSAEVVAVSTIAVFEIKRSDNMRKSQETTSMTITKEYRDRADKWALMRNAAIGVAGGIYVWNVLDAALAKGKIKYAWIPDNMQLKYSEDMWLAYYGVAFNF